MEHPQDQDAPHKGRKQPVERQRPVTRALVLVPVLNRAARTNSHGRKPEGASGRPATHSPDDRRAEAVGLAEAIDLLVVDSIVVAVATPRPGTLFGSGKVEEIKVLVETAEVELVIVDHAVTPIQQRNLEKAWNAKVLDRTGLILEIFGRRARTREGRLQVELAHLSYQKSRLVRSWTHLERQRGGAGFLGGPGESQLELDRRLIQDRVDTLKEELATVVRTRELHRAGRRKVPYPVTAIVGYTNAGKSTLFNRLTGAGVLAKDQVFATLDPTMREVKLATGRRIILSDTVGFISDLPTTLVAAFRATLEEVIEADLVLHVRDISHPESDAQAADVAHVLGELGVATEGPTAHILEVWNKIDRLSPEAREEATHAARRNAAPPVLVSAVTGEGLDELLGAIDSRLAIADVLVDVVVKPEDGRLLAWLYANAEVVAREADAAGVAHLTVRVPADKRHRLDQQLKARA
ncbi:MAG: GTPase HflX [Hyphomicrobiaceae bacterium]|nr:GTPase HflX [Hyphomicrobiaceae bacterium]